MAVATLFFAAGWAVAAHHLATHVGSVNLARLFGAMMAASAGAGAPVEPATGADVPKNAGSEGLHLDNTFALSTRSSVPQTQPSTHMGPRRGLLSIFSAARPTEAQQEEIRRLRQQTAAVEGILIVWRIAMCVAAALMIFLALFALITRHARRCLLGVSGIIFLGTLLTLVTMHLLERPDLGGFPPLSVLSYGIVAIVQSAYGFVLIALRSRQSPVASDQ